MCIGIVKKASLRFTLAIHADFFMIYRHLQGIFLKCLYSTESSDSLYKKLINFQIYNTFFLVHYEKFLGT